MAGQGNGQRRNHEGSGANQESTCNTVTMEDLENMQMQIQRQQEHINRLSLRLEQFGLLSPQVKNNER